MPQPRVRQHVAQAILDTMVEQADDNGVWTGRLTDLVRLHSGSISAYSQIVNVLKSAGAIEQVKRGGGFSPSVWQIMDKDANLDRGTTKPSALSKRGSAWERLSALERKVDRMMLDHLKEHHGTLAED